MKTKIVALIILIVLIINGCGEGSTSSFDTSDNAPVITGLTIIDGNISSVVKEENGEYKIFVNENQRTAFKISAIDNNNVTYALSGGDWRLFDVDKYAGEFFFKDYTDFESKKDYKTLLIADDGLGHITKKRVSIFVNDMKNEIEPIEAVDLEDGLIFATPINTDFITTWQVESNSKTITIPTIGDGYNYSVDWGDGKITTNIIRNIRHTYSKEGLYTVKIYGDFPRIYFRGLFSSDNPNLQLKSIEQWGENQWKSMSGAFAYCSNLTITAEDTPNLSKVTNSSEMFINATSFNQDLENWDVSTITNMHGMFDGTISLETKPSWYQE